MPIVEQLRDKAHALEQLLADHLGGLEVKWQLPPSLPLHFRTRILYPVRPGSDGRPIVGIYQPRSHELVRVPGTRRNRPVSSAPSPPDWRPARVNC
jgi:tRNA/tmRNA/rRNA uracil-C5-methylase (TrmA/RlmC/RlmD family)